MHELYELKEMLCKELEKYGQKGDLSTGSLDVVDKLAHTIKNLEKIIESYDDDYSNYDGGMTPYERGGSYARGRGRNARRDSMGRYSSEGYSRASGEVVEKLYDLMGESPENMKHEIKRFIAKIENMQ